MYDKFLVSSYKKNLKPITGALQVLLKLKEKYELVLVTSRDNRTTDLTHRALSEHYPKIFSTVYFTPALAANAQC